MARKKMSDADVLLAKIRIALPRYEVTIKKTSIGFSASTTYKTDIAANRKTARKEALNEIQALSDMLLKVWMFFGLLQDERERINAVCYEHFGWLGG